MYGTPPAPYPRRVVCLTSETTEIAFAVGAGEWYFFTDRATVWRVVPGSWKTDGLIAFVFEHKPQDIDRFRRASLRTSSDADHGRP